jgi:hypothetical protein
MSPPRTYIEIIFFLYLFLANHWFDSPLLPLTEVSPQPNAIPGATHQEIGSQLRVGEMPDSNPGLHGNSLARYH